MTEGRWQRFWRAWKRIGWHMHLLGAVFTAVAGMLLFLASSGDPLGDAAGIVVLAIAGLWFLATLATALAGGTPGLEEALFDRGTWYQDPDDETHPAAPADADADADGQSAVPPTGRWSMWDVLFATGAGGGRLGVRAR